MSSDDTTHINNIVSNYLSTISRAATFVLEDDERLQQANYIILLCYQLGITTNAAFTTIEAVSIFQDLTNLYSLDYKGGSTIGKKGNIDRNRKAAFERLMEDYFSPQSTYPKEKFRRRFRMSQDVFSRVVDGVTQHDDYFQQKPDALKKHKSFY